MLELPKLKILLILIFLYFCVLVIPPIILSVSTLYEIFWSFKKHSKALTPLSFPSLKITWWFFSSKWDTKSIAFWGLYHWSQGAATAITPAVLGGSEGILDLMMDFRTCEQAQFLLAFLSPVPTTPDCVFSSSIQPSLLLSSSWPGYSQILRMFLLVAGHHIHCFTHSVFFKTVPTVSHFFPKKLLSVLLSPLLLCSGQLAALTLLLKFSTKSSSLFSFTPFLSPSTLS